MSFDVNKRVTVYVAIDVRRTRPSSWMNEWVITDYIIESTDTHFECYKNVFDPGKITLGGNDGENSSSMYLVIVKEMTSDMVDTTPPLPPTGVTIEKL